MANVTILRLPPQDMTHWLQCLGWESKVCKAELFLSSSQLAVWQPLVTPWPLPWNVNRGQLLSACKETTAKARTSLHKAPGTLLLNITSMLHILSKLFSIRISLQNIPARDDDFSLFFFLSSGIYLWPEGLHAGLPVSLFKDPLSACASTNNPPPQKNFLPWLLAACQGSLCIHSAEMRCSSWEFSDHSLCGSPLTSVVIFVEAQPDCRANTRLLI